MPPTGLLGFTFGSSEAEVLSQLNIEYAAGYSLTQQQGDVTIGESHYYYVPMTLCGRPAFLRLWIGLGRLTTIEVKWSAQIGLVDQCARNLFPLDLADRVEHGVFPLYFFERDLIVPISALYVPQGTETLLKVMWLRF